MSEEEPGGVRRSQEIVGTQEESGRTRRSLEEPEGARMSEEEPGEARRSQEEPGGAVAIWLKLFRLPKLFCCVCLFPTQLVL